MSAYEIYEMCKDMDYADYEDDYASDIAFISALLQELGVGGTLAVLREMDFNV